MALNQYSETNIADSFSLYLAEQLLDEGYLIYWHARDAVQTDTGVYTDYSTKSAQYALDSTFATALAAAKGLITLSYKVVPTNKAFTKRPTTDGSVAGQDSILVPYMAIEVGPPVEGLAIGLGDEPSEWFRHLMVFGCARDDREQGKFVDGLTAWFRSRIAYTVEDHDAGTAATVGDIEILGSPVVDSATNPTAPEATRFEIACSAQLRYVA